MKLSDIKTIIFDYDGTIHDSFFIYQKAFLEAYDDLVKKKAVPNRIWKSEEVKKFLGQNPKDMWESFEPKLSEEDRQKASSIISQSMKKQIEHHEARLYDGALEMLSYLKKQGYKLIYLSNSKRYYMDANKAEFNLEDYFDQMICSEDYDFISKTDIIKQIRGSLIEKIVLIGDRIHDINAGYENDIVTIACDYGYGDSSELQNATYHINHITELKNYF